MFEFLKRKKEYPLDANEQYQEIEQNFLETVSVEYIKTKKPELYRAMEDEFYRSYDFNRLYMPAEEADGFTRYIPHATLVVSVILLIKSLF